MDKIDRILSNIVTGEKEFSNSILNFNEMQFQMEQKLGNNEDWLSKKEMQMTKINTEFDKIRREIR